MPTIHIPHSSGDARTACGKRIDDPLFVVVGEFPTCLACLQRTTPGRKRQDRTYKNPERSRVADWEWEAIAPFFERLVERLGVGALASELGVGHGRVSDWAQGKFRPSRPYFRMIVAKVGQWSESLQLAKKPRAKARG